jgi:hypothetical protein
MRPPRCVCLCVRAVVGLVGVAWCALPQTLAQNDPHLGYVYPAGGRAGTEITVAVGGQYLKETTEVLLTGDGIQATIGKHKKPLSEGEANQVRDKIDQVRDTLKAENKEFDLRAKSGAYEEALELLKAMNVTEEVLDALQEFQKRRDDEKRQLNPAIEETIAIQLKIDATAPVGRREVRLKTASGVSNPLGFYVDAYPETMEEEPNDDKAGDLTIESLPAVLNGQIMPGDVDRFRFQAKKGDKLVFVVRARELVPYLADAVPGWFQSILTLYDANNREVAYADDNEFRPDPVLYYRIPQDGKYELEIRDSIYRGREDFVYRITVGPIPFIAHVFPLGMQAGQSGTFQLYGWNLPTETVTFDATGKDPGRYPLSVENRKFTSNQIMVAVDALPEVTEEEPNNDQASAPLLKPPVIVNGRIDPPGDWDIYRFDGRAGGQVIVEVLARHLDSPLDSLLKLTDASGKLLMLNDDLEDPGAGLTTHHADSQLLVTLPTDGSFFIHVGDTQKKGGPAYAYRLRVSARRPDFELRVVPSAISARPGSTVPITVHALRRDTFDQDIQLSLKDAPAGFAIGEPWIRANQAKVQIALTVPKETRDEPFVLQIEGRADMRGRELVRSGVPAEDMMQAFAYQHLVPAEHLVVYVTDKAPGRAAAEVAKDAPKVPENLLKIPTGSMVRYQLAIPDRPNLDDVGVELSEPPPGLSLVRVIRGPGGLVMLISADAETAKPGLKGTLVLNVFAEKSVPGSGGKAAAKRRVPIGSFPPVPFEVVAR